MEFMRTENPSLKSHPDLYSFLLALLQQTSWGSQLTGKLTLSAINNPGTIIMQADLLFKQEEKEKSEATAKTLDLGKNVIVQNVFPCCVCVWCNAHVCMHSVYLENAKLQMDLVKVEEVSSVTPTTLYHALPWLSHT